MNPPRLADRIPLPAVFLLVSVLPHAALGDEPPRPLPPALTGAAAPTTDPVTPAAAPAPVEAAATEAPFARFQPLNAFPPATQHAVRAAVLGGNWLVRMNQANGRFQYGFNPALYQPLDGDNEPTQASAALALARAARFTGDDRQAAVAGQALLALLANTRVDPATPTVRTPVGMADEKKAGFAACVALALYDLPGADGKATAEADRLCEFLKSAVAKELASAPTQPTPNGSPTPATTSAVEAQTAAMRAIVASRRTAPAAWKDERIKAAVASARQHFRAAPSPQLAAGLTPAFADWYAQTKDPVAAAAVFEMADWIAGQQHPMNDPRRPLWGGGFRGFENGRATDAVLGWESAACVEALAHAVRVTRQVPDRGRYVKYRQAAVDGLGFVTGLQYTEANTRHFENNFRATFLVGGFTLSPTDGTLRADATAAGVSAALAYLQSGAERE